MRAHRWAFCCGLILGVASACGGSSTTPAASPGTADSGRDAALDGALETGMDGSADAGADAGMLTDGPVLADQAADVSDANTCTGAVPGPGSWPRSATLFCSDGSKAIATCPTAGDPAYGQDGDYPQRPPSYTTAAGMVTDAVTKLIWQQSPDANAVAWAQVDGVCSSLRLGGNADWRVPTRVELLSLADYGRVNPAIDSTAFPAVNDVFWAHSASNPAEPWAVSFADGALISEIAEATHRVICARGSTASGAFAADPGGAFGTDSRTGLVWQYAPAATGVSWLDGLAKCRASTLDGRSDWRVPTIKELETLLDPAACPPSWLGQMSAVWSSTPSAEYPTSGNLGAPSAWTYDPGASGPGQVAMTAQRDVRCVRFAAQ